MSRACVLCAAKHCTRAESCDRHRRSGRVPVERQRYSDYSEYRWWRADACLMFDPAQTQSSTQEHDDAPIHL